MTADVAQHESSSIKRYASTFSNIQIKLCYTRPSSKAPQGQSTCQSRSSSNAFYSSLLADCRSLLGRFQHYKVQHAFREVNRVADALAKLGCVMKEQFVILNSPPSDTISCYVLSDVNGESFCRLSAPNLAILA